jgi:hypothetical protein
MGRTLLTFAAVAAAFLTWQSVPSAVAQEPAASGQESSLEGVIAAFAEQGVRVDPAAGRIEIDAVICQRYEPLEYLLVKRPAGKEHESLLASQGVSAEALNAAMLLLGVEKGNNGQILPVDPPPTLEEVQAGAVPYTVKRADGDGFYIYVTWELEDAGRVERYTYRAEDLVLNVRRETTMARSRWVYLGSRFLKPHKDAEEFFAAEGEGNLVSIVYFSPANHLLTGADPMGDDQNIWYPNAWLLPPVEHPVKVVFSRESLDLLP